MIKPKKWLLTYDQNNVGILKRNKSQRLSEGYLNDKIEREVVPFQEFKEKFSDVPQYYHYKDHYASSLNHIRNPDYGPVSNRTLNPPYSTYKG